MPLQFNRVNVVRANLLVVASLAGGCQSDSPGAGGAAIGTSGSDVTATTSDNAVSDPRATALVEQGHADYEGGRWLAAAEAYSAALEHDPDNQQALEGLAAARARVDRQGRIDEAQRFLDLRAAAAIAEFDAGYQRSLQALEDSNFELARGAILHARASLLENGDLIPRADLESRDAKAAELLLAIDRMQELHARSEG